MGKNTFKITCYGETKEYPESKRKKMEDFYLDGMLSCDGSESERYQNIYFGIANGSKNCTDLMNFNIE